MEAILDCIAQPVWVVDHDGLISYVNPAGVAALGYDDLAELCGRPGHDTIHYKHVDGSPFPASECPMSKSRATGETVVMEEDWFVRRDGTMFPVSYVSTTIDTPDGQGPRVCPARWPSAGAAGARGAGPAGRPAPGGGGGSPARRRAAPAGRPPPPGRAGRAPGRRAGRSCARGR